MATSVTKKSVKSKPKTTSQSPLKNENKIAKRTRVVAFLERKDEDHLIFTGFVVIIIALVTIVAIEVVTRPRMTVVTATAPLHSRILTSNEHGLADGYEVTISNVTVNNDQDQAFPLNADETMLILDMSITNHTTSTQDFVPVTQLYVRSREGNYYQMHASMHVQNPIAATSIEPEQTLSGQVSFAVPKRLSNPLLYIDTGWNDSTPIVFNVLK